MILEPFTKVLPCLGPIDTLSDTLQYARDDLSPIGSLKRLDECIDNISSKLHGIDD